MRNPATGLSTPVMPWENGGDSAENRGYRGENAQPTEQRDETAPRNRAGSGSAWPPAGAEEPGKDSEESQGHQIPVSNHPATARLIRRLPWLPRSP